MILLVVIVTINIIVVILTRNITSVFVGDDVPDTILNNSNNTNTNSMNSVLVGDDVPDAVACEDEEEVLILITII